MKSLIAIVLLSIIFGYFCLSGSEFRPQKVLKFNLSEQFTAANWMEKKRGNATISKFYQPHVNSRVKDHLSL